MTRYKKLTLKYRTDIMAAWEVLLKYANDIDNGIHIDLTDHEALIIGQIMNTKDRYDWLRKITLLFRPKSRSTFTFPQIHKAIESERKEHEELKTLVKTVLSHLPTITEENVDGTAEIPIKDLLAIKYKMRKLN